MDKLCSAVVTGDVNASSMMSKNDAQLLETTLHSCFAALKESLWENNDVVGFTVFRGDSWQFVVREPGFAIHNTLLFRATLINRSYEEFGKRLHTSAAIGYGPIDFLPNEFSLAGGGEAFRLSGKRLDKIRTRRPGMGMAGLGEVDTCFDVMLGILDSLIRRWTPSQARALTYALQGLVQEEIAHNWNPPITQQSVHKHLITAGWPAIEPALRWTKTAAEGCNKDNSH